MPTKVLQNQFPVLVVKKMRLGEFKWLAQLRWGRGRIQTKISLAPVPDPFHYRLELSPTSESTAAFGARMDTLYKCNYNLLTWIWLRTVLPLKDISKPASSKTESTWCDLTACVSTNASLLYGLSGCTHFSMLSSRYHNMKRKISAREKVKSFLERKHLLGDRGWSSVDQSKWLVGGPGCWYWNIGVPIS